MDITKSKLSGKTRTEHDLLGYKEVPEEYYFGIQTLRALENFDISRSRLYFYPEFIKALAVVKEAAALANKDLGVMDAKVADAIVEADVEVTELMGAEIYLYLVTDETNLIARVSPRSKTRAGDIVNIAIDMTRVHIFDKETERCIIH